MNNTLSNAAARDTTLRHTHTRHSGTLTPSICVAGGRRRSARFNCDETDPAPVIKLERLSLILPFYFARNSTVARIPRAQRHFPPPRRYQGYDRLSQVLRHVSTSVYRAMKQRWPVSSKEVQAAMIAGRLGISSNFASEQIAGALHDALQSPQHRGEAHAGHAKPHHARERRHAAKLRAFAHADDRTLHGIVALADAEMKADVRNMPLSGIDTLSHDIRLQQFIGNIWALRDALQRAANGDVTRLLIVPSFSYPGLTGLLPEGITQARHAERNITDYIATHAAPLRVASLRFFGHGAAPIVIPIEGRYLPCGACYEQERMDTAPGGGGLFDPQGKGFLLYRSSHRVGPFFPNEVQHYATRSMDAAPELGRGKARTISWRLLHQPTMLEASRQHATSNSYLNTDSEYD